MEWKIIIMGLELINGKLEKILGKKKDLLQNQVVIIWVKLLLRNFIWIKQGISLCIQPMSSVLKMDLIMTFYKCHWNLQRGSFKKNRSLVNFFNLVRIKHGEKDKINWKILRKC
jgi:hypothetical protein